MLKSIQKDRLSTFGAGLFSYVNLDRPIYPRSAIEHRTIDISVDRAIYPHSGIDDRTGPENLKIECRKNTFKSSHLTNENTWIDRPELPGDFGTLSRNSKGNVDR